MPSHFKYCARMMRVEIQIDKKTILMVKILPGTKFQLSRNILFRDIM